VTLTPSLPTPMPPRPFARFKRTRNRSNDRRSAGSSLPSPRRSRRLVRTRNFRRSSSGNDVARYLLAGSTFSAGFMGAIQTGGVIPIALTGVLPAINAMDWHPVSVMPGEDSVIDLNDPDWSNLQQYRTDSHPSEQVIGRSLGSNEPRSYSSYMRRASISSEPMPYISDSLFNSESSGSRRSSIVSSIQDLEMLPSTHAPTLPGRILDPPVLETRRIRNVHIKGLQFTLIE